MRRLNIERMRRHRVARIGMVALLDPLDDDATTAQIDTQLARVTRAHPGGRLVTWLLSDHATGTLWLHWEVR